MVGATIAPPLIAWLALQYGWRAAFVITGAAGFVWLAVWLVVYRSPDGAEPARTKEPIRWGPILRDRSVWGLAITRLIADPVWYFYLFWFPKYLTDERGMGTDSGREPRLDRLSRGRYRQRRRRLFLRPADSFRHRSGDAAD